MMETPAQARRYVEARPRAARLRLLSLLAVGGVVLAGAAAPKRHHAMPAPKTFDTSNTML